MTEKQKLNWSMGLSIAAIILSVICLGVYIFKIDSCDIVGTDTFIAVIAAFIGISVTLVVGFQIYSVLSIKDKLSSIDSLQQELIKTKNDLAIQKNNLLELEIELKGNISRATSTLYDTQEKYVDAFKELNNAILCYSCLDSRKEDLQTLVDLLNVYSERISINDFPEKSKVLHIDIFLKIVENDFIRLKETKYYWAIKDKYQKIYNTTCNKVEAFKDNSHD